MNPEGLLKAEGERVFELLKKTKQRLVLAESCTGGGASAALTRLPGISNFFCGSFVVYRIASKTEWLQIPGTLIRKSGVVSAEVAQAMAIGALRQTPESDLAASITGELGPSYSQKKAGQLFLSIAIRKKKEVSWTFRKSLQHPVSPHASSLLQLKQRHHAQLEASHSLLLMVRSLLSELHDIHI